MSNQQIIDVLSGSSNVCGRFIPAQMVLLNQSFKTQKAVQGFWKKLAIAAAILLCSVPVYKAEAKEKPVITLQPINAGDKIQKQKTDTTAQITISGKIVDKENGESLPGTVIRVPNTNIKTVSNGNGEFQLVISARVKKIEVLALGYEMLQVKIKPKRNRNLNFALKMSQAIMGEVAIVEN